MFTLFKTLSLGKFERWFSPLQNGYAAKNRSLIEDAKFESQNNQETQERILQQHRRSSIKRPGSAGKPGDLEPLDETEDRDLILAAEWSEHLDPKEKDMVILASTFMLSLRDGLAILPTILLIIQVFENYLLIITLGYIHYLYRICRNKRPEGLIFRSNKKSVKTH